MVVLLASAVSGCASFSCAPIEALPELKAGRHDDKRTKRVVSTYRDFFSEQGCKGY